MTLPSLRFVAFYLPQFHPIPENDEWWGKGFTEWRNVATARPRFRGHYQPHIPADLGFYDLRLAETRKAQADLARAYGVDAFCYYHYWFGGKRLLERPFEEVLESGEPDFPFMLCWANENWTRTWDGADSQLLMGQAHSPEDDRAHIRSLLSAFADPRYVTIDSRPVFLVYRASILPDSRRTTDIWREETVKAGLPEPYLCRVEAHGPDRGDPRPLGFDAAVEFQPDVKRLGPRVEPSRIGRALRRVFRPHSGYRFNQVREFGDLVSRSREYVDGDYRRYRCVTPSWDNSARRAEWAWIYRGSSPELYEQWLQEVVEGFDPPSRSENLVFVNAWNEWAEGNHLEPDLRYGRAYLEAHRRVASKCR